MPDGMVMAVRQHIAISSILRVRGSDVPALRLFADPDQAGTDRHPWLSTFERAPDQGVADLLSGDAEIGALARLNPSDAAFELFSRLGAEDPARRLLAPAIMAWLEGRRRQQPPEPAPKRQRWIAEMDQAFAIIHVLELGSAATALRRALGTWNLVVEGQAAGSSRDARAGFWWMLALTQPLVAREAPDIHPLGLVEHWLWVCENAGGDLPIHYLDIGLMGLRRLPESDIASAVPWMTGLAVWAAVRRPTESAFRDRWFGLKWQYPREPSFWRDCVGQVLADPLLDGKGIAAPAWWACDPELR